MTIKVSLQKIIDESYEVIIGQDHIKQLTKHLHVLGVFGSYVIITDNRVKNLFGNKLKSILAKHNARTFLLSFPAGETSKTQKIKTFLEEQMLKNNCGRDTLIIALGGGVVGDMAGFVAATYMRGIPYVQVPTTLLAMVDSSLGGKTGIDTAQGKNMIGAFWQPKKIFIDLDFIKNLPLEQILNGYFEIVKMSITSNKKLFYFAEKNLRAVQAKNVAVLKHLIIEGLKIKARIVEKDEKENDDRMILNFGHTIGHTLEKLSNYQLMHGYAVGLGIIAEAKISQLEGFLPKASYDRIELLLVKSGIDKSILGKWKPKKIIASARKDKKTKGGRLRVVLIKDIGQLHKKENLSASFISDEMIKRALTLV